METVQDDRPLDWMMKSTITGLAALVVGGGSGMGAACARTFAANGGLVAVADLNFESASSVADQIIANGGSAIAVKLDVGCTNDIDSGVAAAVKAFGRLDVLINVAVLVNPVMLEEVERESWEAAFDVNVWRALELARRCLPHLRKSPAPAIVLAGSLAGVNGYAGSGSYGPSKAGLIALARQMALEWAIDGIRVNVVIPGTILTPALRRDLSETAIETRVKQVPLGRLSFASEQADVAIFLASPVASFVTGQYFIVDGGFSQNLYPQPMRMSETLRERAARLSVIANRGSPVR